MPPAVNPPLGSFGGFAPPPATPLAKTFSDLRTGPANNLIQPAFSDPLRQPVRQVRSQVPGFVRRLAGSFEPKGGFV